MGIDPESLEISSVSITGVNGKRLQSQTRQMHVKIVNTKNNAESWEKVYVSPEIKISLLSKDCLVRLRVIDPKQFLTDTEVRSFSINTVDEKRDKLSACEKSFFTQEDGTIGCKCDRRKAPPVFKKSYFEKAFTILSKREGYLSDNYADFLKGHF